MPKFTRSLLSVLVFLFPLFFTTLTFDLFDTNKMGLLAVIVPLLLLSWTLVMVMNKKIIISVSKLNLLVILFAASYILSTLVSSVNKVESLVFPTGTGVIIALVVLYFIVSNIVDKKEQITYPIIAAAVILALAYIAQFTGITPKIFNYEFLKTKAWTPVGPLFTLSVMLAASIPLAIEEAIGKKNPKNYEPKQIMAWCATIIISLGLMFTLFAQVTSEKPVIPPYETTWSIAVDTIKTLKTAAFGVGPGQYITAFTQARPLSFNNNKLWYLRFENASNFYFQLITEIGLIGFIIYLFIILNVIKTGQKNLSQGGLVSLIILFTSQLFLPTSTVILFLIFVLLGLFALRNKSADLVETGYILPRVFFAMAVVVALTTYWFSYKWYMGEIYYAQAMTAANENKGIDTYNLLIKATQTNPNLDKYRLSYSQVNLALANSIAQKGANLNDQDRQNISTLIQQAVREAKVATSLDPLKAGNWENLAFVYRNLINATQGADQWTIASYNEAIKLDPLNPNLRISLGGVLYNLKDYDGAIQQFTIAVNLKSDLANAHYNLASAYREKADYQRAFQEMQNTLALVDPNSNDFNVASAELEELRKKLPPQTKQTGQGSSSPETLTEPSAQSGVAVEPKISLPAKEVAPEIPATETPVQPSVTPKPTVP